MSWQFWLRGRGPTPLSTQVRNAVIDRFDISSEVVDGLTMIRKSGKFAGRKVTHLRIFNSDSVSSEITRYSDLDSQPGSISFTGRLETGGYLYLDEPKIKPRQVPAVANSD